MRIHKRKSALKGRRMHGYRAKPYTHRPRGKKLKNLKLMLKARRKRRDRLDGKRKATKPMLTARRKRREG